MAQPTAFDRQTSFALFSAENPDTAHSGTDLDAEFNAVKVAIDETQANLALIQDDDGELKRGSVGRAQLDSSITLGIAPPELWTTSTEYVADVDVIFKDLILYICAEDHTSGTFSTDLAAGKWTELADFSATAAIENGSIDTIHLADGAVTEDKIENNAVTADKIATGSVSAGKLASNAVTTAKIADLNVTTAKIDDLAVTTGKLNDGAVTAAKMAANAIAAQNLAHDAFAQAAGMANGTFTASCASNILTVALKTLAGTDPSATDPVHLFFRNPTQASGSYDVVEVTSALSLSVPDTATLGTTNAVGFRLWLVVFNDGGTARLGLINCATATQIFPLIEGIPVSSTTIGTGADSAGVFYTDAGVTTKAYRIIGHIDFSDGQATAGTWATAPDALQLFGPGVKKPGDIVQVRWTGFSTQATGTTQMPIDDTIPVGTGSAEGDEYMTQAITPTSKVNKLVVEAKGNFTNGTSTNIAMALFQDATAAALAAVNSRVVGAGDVMSYFITHMMAAATVSATTFKVRAGASGAGTTTFNGSGGNRLFGGVYNSFMRATELMV